MQEVYSRWRIEVTIGREFHRRLYIAQSVGTCISFPMGIATLLTSYPSATSRADPDRGLMQIIPSRNLTAVTVEMSIFTAATVIRVWLGKALLLETL